MNFGEKDKKKWQKTLQSKPLEEIARINKLKVAKGFGVSKGEKELSEYVKTLLKENTNFENQFYIKINNLGEGKNGFLCDIRVNNKIIEYFGDFWHVNPKFYKEKKYVPRRRNITVGEIHKRDNKRIRILKKLGFKTLVVWEDDWINNQDNIKIKIKKFLDNGNSENNT